MLKIGITGGIGSGKTTVSKVFETLGIPVYYADDAAKVLMNTDTALAAGIREAFGEAAYNSGVLDRKYLAGKVFNDVQKLEQLNRLVHPATLADAAAWMERQETPYVIKEAALIFESGSQQQLQKVIGVYAPTHLRIQRVMQRDGVTREAVLSRMDKQINETIKMRLCDYVIDNDEQQLLIPQVLAVHEKLLALAAEQA